MISHAEITAITGHALVEDDRIRRLTHQSSLREKVLEYKLLGEIGTELIERDIDFAVLHSMSDRDGYDLVMETADVVRHIQLKTTTVGATTRVVPINTRLALKPSGCILWSVFDPPVRGFAQVRWFGGLPGEPLPDLGSKPVKHSKANAEGIKAIKPGFRELGLARFERLSTIGEVVDRLFGPEAA